MKHQLLFRFFLFNFYFFSPFLFPEGNITFGQVVSSEIFEKKIKEFTGDRTGKPGSTIIVNQNNKNILYYAAGIANLENNIFIDSNTVFEAASVSKQFTASAILLLCEELLISLDDNVRKYIPELPDYGYTITIRHLLLHTSGLKDWRNITYLHPVYTATRLYNQKMALDLICKQKSLNFKPGDQYRYSNSGYDLLGEIVERVSGRTFSQFAKENLLEPAGMTNSNFRNKYTDIIKNRATGYLKSGENYLQGIVLDETCGAAGLYTTVSDLQKWNEYMASDKVSDNFKKLRTTQGVLNNGKKIPYALGGVEIHNYKGHKEIRHGGLISGYRAWLVYYPETGISASYLSNDRTLQTTELSKIIREVCFGEETDTLSFIKTEFPLKQLEDISGLYQNINDFSVSLNIQLKDGKLFSGNHPVRFIDKGKISINNQIYNIKQNRLIQISETGNFIFEKATPLTDNINYELLTGTYYSEDVSVNYKISLEENILYASSTSWEKIKLTPLQQSGQTLSFRGNSNGLAIIFHFTKKSGEINLSLSLPRADKIPFVKIN